MVSEASQAVAWGGKRGNKSVFTYTNIKIDLKYLHVTHNYVSLNITTHHFRSRLMTTRHYPSLYITLHYTPSLHITVHHYQSISITTHYYPPLHITVHHYTSLPITTHHYPSLHITVHHYTTIHHYVPRLPHGSLLAQILFSFFSQCAAWSQTNLG